MRRRILLLVVGMTTLVVLAFAIPLVFLIRNAVAQRADDLTVSVARDVSLQLARSAHTEAQVRKLEQSYAPRDVTITSVPPGTDPDEQHDGDGPPGAGHPDTPLHDVPGGREADAFSPGFGAANGYRVTVFESDDVRYEGAHGWYLLLALASLGLVLVGAAAGELLTRRIARPLVRTAETAQQLSVGDTAARAPTDGPREVAEVGKALNQLADRIDELIAEERETVADLSHRLRTPLTTLRLDAEALADPSEAERVGAHVSDLERMLTAVIYAARRPQREGRMPSSDASAVVGKRVEFWSALTEEQGRVGDLSLPHEPLLVRASAEDLAAAVDALLENVVAHTPDGTDFAVRLVRTDTGARLEIADSGPGIPDAAELRGRSDRGSSGLGLDIARRCAEASGGAMTISRSPSGGALVRLDLGGA
jgi:signal transduction histidine kinase